MLKIYIKNEYFQIHVTFAQTPLKLSGYQSYQYKGLIVGYLMIYYAYYSLGKQPSFHFYSFNMDIFFNIALPVLRFYRHINNILRNFRFKS